MKCLQRQAKSYNGVTYPLSHTNSHVIAFHLKTGQSKLKCRVRINYSCHVFTEKEEQPSTVGSYVEGGEKRKFCVQRYQDSLRLPASLTACFQQNHKLYKTIDGNGATSYALQDPQHDPSALQVVLRARRARGKAEQGFDFVVYVASAYRPSSAPRKQDKRKAHTFLLKC